MRTSIVLIPARREGSETATKSGDNTRATTDNQHFTCRSQSPASDSSAPRTHVGQPSPVRAARPPHPTAARRQFSPARTKPPTMAQPRPTSLLPLCKSIAHSGRPIPLQAWRSPLPLQIAHPLPVSLSCESVTYLRLKPFCISVTSALAPPLQIRRPCKPRHRTPPTPGLADLAANGGQRFLQMVSKVRFRAEAVLGGATGDENDPKRPLKHRNNQLIFFFVEGVLQCATAHGPTGTRSGAWYAARISLAERRPALRGQQHSGSRPLAEERSAAAGPAPLARKARQLFRGGKLHG